MNGVKKNMQRGPVIDWKTLDSDTLLEAKQFCKGRYANPPSPKIWCNVTQWKKFGLQAKTLQDDDLAATAKWKYSAIREWLRLNPIKPEVDDSVIESFIVAFRKTPQASEEKIRVLITEARTSKETSIEHNFVTQVTKEEV
jgi:hypothetical protein